MRILGTVTLGFASILMLVATRSVFAAPLDPADVPADAKWVIHLDFDAFEKTTLAQKLHQEQPEWKNQWLKIARQWSQARYGVDPRKDLHGLTIFSDSYQAHTGAAILQADYDPEKLQSELKNTPQMKTVSWRDDTLYIFGDQPQKRTGKKPSVKETAVTPTIVLWEGKKKGNNKGKKLVFASSPDRSKAALQLLSNDSPSLQGKETQLIADIPAGAVAYGAAIDLEKITRHDVAFPILRQHERIVWVTGEQGEQMFENLRSSPGLRKRLAK